MKVRNIMFTGFMAAILSATGAHAAISVASQAYVDNKVKANADAITEITKDSGTIDAKVAAAVAPLATTQSVTDLAGTVAGHTTDIAGLKQADIDLAADIKSNSDAIALLTGGEEGEGTLKELTDKINDNAAAIEVLTADAATKDSVAYDIAEALKSYSTTEQVNAKDAATLDSAKEYTDSKFSSLSDTTGTLTTDLASLQSVVNTKANKTEVEATVATLATKEEMKAVSDVADAAQTAEEVSAAINAAVTAEGGVVKTAIATATNDMATKTYVGEQDTATLNSAKSYAEEQASAVAAKLKLLATADVPQACTTPDGSNICVLTMTSDGTFAWTPLTAPVETPAN